MCQLSIVVPRGSDNAAFEDTLISVLENRPADCQVLVVHAGPYDDPYDLCDEVEFVEVAESADMVAAANAGFAAAQGEVIHLLRPSVVARNGWTEPAVDWFSDPCIAAVSPVIVQAENNDRILSAGLRYSAGGGRRVNGVGVKLKKSRTVFRQNVVGPTLDAAFYRRTVIEKLGGFAACVGASFADIDLALSIKSLRLRSVLEPDSRLSGPSELLATEPPSFKSGRFAERLFWRHAPATGWAKALPCHALAVAGSLLLNAHRTGGYTQFFGRAVASFEILCHRRHCRMLDSVRAELHAEIADADANRTASYAIDDYRRRSPCYDDDRDAA